MMVVAIHDHVIIVFKVSVVVVHHASYDYGTCSIDDIPIIRGMQVVNVVVDY